MPLVTVTETDTVPVLTTETVTPVQQDTVTTYSYTTLPATPGQLITVFVPTPIASAAPSASDYSSLTETVTVTELDILLQGPQGDFWTTITLDVGPGSSPPPFTLSNGPFPPGETVFVAGSPGDGWDTWTHAQKSGLIAGVILFVAFLTGLIWCVHKQRKEWLVHERVFPWERPVVPPPHPSNRYSGYRR
jgi:hypothetical protein